MGMRKRIYYSPHNRRESVGIYRPLR